MRTGPTWWRTRLIIDPAESNPGETRSLALIGFVLMAGGQAAAVVLPLQAESFATGPAYVGLLVASFFVARLVADLLAAITGGARSPRYAMAIGGALLAVGAIAGAVASSFGVLILARLCQGFGYATALLAVLRRVVSVRTRRDVAQSVATLQTAQLLGVMVGPLIGGVLASRFGLLSPYWLLAFLATVVMIMARPWRSAGAGQTVSTGGRAGLRTVVSSLDVSARRLILIALAMEFLAFVARIGGQLTVVPLLAVNELGASPSQVGLALAVSGVAHLAFVPVALRVTQSLDRTSAIALALFGMGTAIALHFTVKGFVGLLVVSAITGMTSASAFMLPAVTVSEIAPKENALPVILGLYRASGSLGSVLGPIAIGLLLEAFSTRQTLLLTGTLLIAASVVVHLERRRTGG